MYQILLRDTERPYIIHKIKKTNKLKVTNYKKKAKTFCSAKVSKHSSGNVKD